MNYAIIRVWREEAESVFVKFSDREIVMLYDKIISLEKDAEFLDPLRDWNKEYYDYFLEKISYIRENKKAFEGESTIGPLEIPRTTRKPPRGLQGPPPQGLQGPLEMPKREDLELSNQKAVNWSLDKAVQIGL
jgi:hypothetical protein